MSEKKYKLKMIVYDGINFFKDGTWTLLEFPSVEEGRNIIGFLETLSNEQVDHWIRVQMYLKESNKTFNALKFNKTYSGQTTCYPHLRSEVARDDKWKDTPFAGASAIYATNIFEVQWSNCPVEVADEVKRLWKEDDRLGNDAYYYSWESDETDGEDSDINRYPIIAAYLKSQGITECLIHWWW